jgi:hypothetical protein
MVRSETTAAAPARFWPVQPSIGLTLASCVIIAGYLGGLALAGVSQATIATVSLPWELRLLCQGSRGSPSPRFAPPSCSSSVTTTLAWLKR